MRKRVVVIFLFLVLCSVAGVFVLKKNSQTQVPVVVSVKKTSTEIPTQIQSPFNEQITFTDVRDTEELKALFANARFDKMPKIFIRRFPEDFSEKGNPGLFATVLLPYLIRQNELLTYEREAFLYLCDKLRDGKKLTPAQETFWTGLVLKYEVLNPDREGQEETLNLRLDRISPSLAVAQALEATDLGKTDLDAPFDVRRWNDKKEYDFVHYPDLEQAVSDYALELNRGQSYLKFHLLRDSQRKSVRRPLIGKKFARGLSFYKIEDPNYIRKLETIFKRYKFQDLDNAKFEGDK